MLNGLPWSPRVPAVSRDKAWAAGLLGLAGAWPGEGARLLNAWSVVCGLESQIPADPQDGGLGCLALLGGGGKCASPGMFMLAGTRSQRVHPAHFNRENGSSEGQGFPQGLSAGPARIRSTNWSSRVDTSHGHATHSSQMWVRPALETGGGVRLAVTRKKAPGRRSPETWTLYGEVAPRAWSGGDRPECPGRGSAPSSQQAWTAPDQLGPGRVRTGIEGGGNTV